MAGLYIHIPFCVSRCGYCDFFSGTDLSLRDEYLRAVAREVERRSSYLRGEPLKTIYMGGGTPSLLTAAEIASLLGRIFSLWDPASVTEITVEANPDDITPEWLDGLLGAGVNRLSIGVQSFDDDDLRRMGRRHDGRQARRAVEAAQKAGFGNISVDLIYGLPWGERRRWRENLDRAIALNIKHISAYHLTIEQGTRFGQMEREGRLRPVADAESIAQFELLHDMAAASGFEHYETSNLALPGFRSRHNSSYWTGEPYLGIGPSAHSFDGLSRQWNLNSLADYVNSDFTDDFIQREELTERDLYNEYIMTSLRRSEGVDVRYIAVRFGLSRAERFGVEGESFLKRGNLCREDSRYYIPPRKFIYGDAVIREFFEV